MPIRSERSSAISSHDWWKHPPTDFDRVLFFGWAREAREFARQCRFGFEQYKMQGRPHLIRVNHSGQVMGHHREKTIYCFGSAPYYQDPFEREAEEVCRQRYHFFEKSKILEVANAPTINTVPQTDG